MTTVQSATLTVTSWNSVQIQLNAFVWYFYANLVSQGSASLSSKFAMTSTGATSLVLFDSTTSSVVSMKYLMILTRAVNFFDLRRYALGGLPVGQFGDLLAVYFRFDEGSGSTVRDASKSQLSITLPTPSSGNNQKIYWDNSADALVIPEEALYDSQTKQVHDGKKSYVLSGAGSVDLGTATLADKY